MESTESRRPTFSEGEHRRKDAAEEDTIKLAAAGTSGQTGVLEKEAIDTLDTAKTASFPQSQTAAANTASDTGNAMAEEHSEAIDTLKLSASPRPDALDRRTIPLQTPPHLTRSADTFMPRAQAFLLIALLLILVLNAINTGYAQFIGPQGWAFVLGGSGGSNNNNLLGSIKNELNHHPTPGATTESTPKITPGQYINLIVQHMTVDQKLGQMMIVQFLGPAYSLDISTMISQYGVGAVLLFTANNNILDKDQLKNLIQQMQRNSAIPLVMAIDQEGGYVDRLKSLDGPRPAAAVIGATNDPGKARAEGIEDAQDLASYGFNLNLAPVVDVTNVYNPQLYGRTYGNNPALVTKMAQAYLQGLQQSGKVLGALKHFPGLGDVGVDPHNGVPDLYRSKSDLEAIDWAPYRSLIQQGNVHAILVTHEVVHAIDDTKPSSLSYKVVTGILRTELGFQGVVITDSLTMEGITAFYSEAQAAALAVQAGCDLLMGAATPRDVASMIEGIKQAIDSGAISQQRIDESVRRILMLKYEMGMLPLPTN